MAQTACAEGAMVITDLRSQLARCAMCAWFNEWHRFGERDQLALSYVLHALGLTPAAEPEGVAPGATSGHRGVYLWPRKDHWRAPHAPKVKPFVKYVGHGGDSVAVSDT